MLNRLGRLIGMHPLLFGVGWIALIVLMFATAVGGLFGETVFDRLSSGVIKVPSESQTGQDLLDATAPAGPAVQLILSDVDPGSSVVRSAIVAARADLVRMPEVSRVLDPYIAPSLTDPQAEPLVAADGRGVLLSAEVRRGLGADRQVAALAVVEQRLREVSADVPGSTGQVGGITIFVDSVTSQLETDLRTGEGIALPISLGIMIVVFGGLVAALLPIGGAIAAIGGALAALMGFSYLLNLDATVVNVVTILGLGLCIDYGLLLVSRYREELHALPGDYRTATSKRQRAEALGRTLDTAGRTVLYSGVTVAVSLCGLLMFRSDILRAFGAAGISAVLVALVVALTLVPTMLALAHGRLIRPGITYRIPGLSHLARALGDTAPEEGVFSRLTRRVQRRPVWVLVGVLALLGVLAAPAAQLNLVASSIKLLPVDAPARVFFDDLGEQFPASAAAPITVVSRAPAPELAQWGAQIQGLQGVTGVDLPITQGDATTGVISVMGVRVDGPDSSEAAKDVVRALRLQRPDFQIWVSGTTAGLIDYVADIRDRAPLAGGVVVLATFVLLFLMTGSVLVPLKALLMNVVSLGACFGVMVWIFQDGHLSGLLGFDSAGGIETSVAPLVLAFGFGLAMDYEVFLLSRIAEYRRYGYGNDKSVVMGLQRSGRIITSAALIIVVVFLGLVGGQILLIKQTGLALAVAVAVDATLVRMLLVPATMILLGERNWWAPAPLRRLHDRFGLTEK